MKRFIGLAMLLALAVGLCAIPMFAQNGTLKGSTKDESGKPMTQGTNVQLEPIGDKGKAMTLELDSKGEFSSTTVPVGSYNVWLVRNGEKIDGRGKVPVESGKETKIDFDVKADRAKMGIDEEQVKKYEEAKKANENIRGLNAMLAQVRDLMKAGNYDQSIALLQPAAAQNPQQDLVWGYLGDAYLSSKKYPEAIDAYNKAIALKPKDGAYLSGLANAYAKSGQADKAVEAYNAAAQAEPAHAATYYFNEGALFTNTQHPQEAVAAFDKAIAADPNKAEAYYYKGENLIAMAKLDPKTNKMIAAPDTAQSFQKYIELKPDGPLVGQAKSYLEALGEKVETSYGKGKTPPKKQ
ncbi:MAG: tetratricopeptide repeat protein [Candidatus Korobacteraceae bacterium]